MIRKAFIVGGVAAVAIFTSPAFGKTKARAATTPGSDQEFVMKAAKADMTEVELGKLAENKASSDEVKTFARHMVDDHQKALDHLKTIAQNEKMNLPTAIDQKDEGAKTQLEKLSGQAFDRAYMRAMVRDHRLDVAEFKAESMNAKSAELKQYASTTLSTLEDHLKLAQRTDRSVVAAAKPASKKPSA
jgi:putative membrane protein